MFISVVLMTAVTSTLAFDTLMNAMDVFQEAFSEENRDVWIKLGEQMKRKNVQPKQLAEMDSQALDDLFQPALAEAEVISTQVHVTERKIN